MKKVSWCLLIPSKRFFEIGRKMTNISFGRLLLESEYLLNGELESGWDNTQLSIFYNLQHVLINPHLQRRDVILLYRIQNNQSIVTLAATSFYQYTSTLRNMSSVRKNLNNVCIHIMIIIFESFVFCKVEWKNLLEILILTLISNALSWQIRIFIWYTR